MASGLTAEKEEILRQRLPSYGNTPLEILNNLIKSASGRVPFAQKH